MFNTRINLTVWVGWKLNSVIVMDYDIYIILAMPRVETRGSQNKITVLNIIVLRKRP